MQPTCSYFCSFLPLFLFLFSSSTLQGHLAAAAPMLALGCIDWKGVGRRRVSWKHHQWSNWSLSEPATSKLLLDWGTRHAPGASQFHVFYVALNGTQAWNCCFCARFPFCCATCQTARVSNMHLPLICGLVPLNAQLTSCFFLFLRSVSLCISSVPMNRCFPCHLARAICLSIVRREKLFRRCRSRFVVDWGVIFIG